MTSMCIVFLARFVISFTPCMRLKHWRAPSEAVWFQPQTNAKRQSIEASSTTAPSPAARSKAAGNSHNSKEAEDGGGGDEEALLSGSSAVRAGGEATTAKAEGSRDDGFADPEYRMRRNVERRRNLAINYVTYMLLMGLGMCTCF